MHKRIIPIALCAICTLCGESRADEATFTPLGFLNPTQPYSSAWGVSADGQTVAATSFSKGNRAVRWTSSGGMQNLGLLPGTDSSSAGFVSHDGSVIAGRSVIGCCTTMSTRWIAADNWQPEYLGPNLHPDNDWGDHTLGISGDGQVVVGQSSTGLPDAGAWHPYRWSEQTGMLSLVAPEEAETTFGAARAASFDGSYVVGWFRPSTSGSMHAFRWNEEDGMVFLGMLGNFGSEARAVSPDGSIVVGDSHTFPIGRTAFMWTEETGMMNKGQWEHQGELKNTVPLAVTADGSIMIGYGMILMGSCPQCSWHHEAVIWDEDNGWRHLLTVLDEEHALGSALFGWTLNEARAISPDGRFIVGEGTNPFGQTEAWIVALPPLTPPCPGDLTSSGSVGVPDLLALLSQWGPCPKAPKPSGQCDGFCGNVAPAGCWCDEFCDDVGDCCEDVCDGCADLPHCPGGGAPPCPADLTGNGSVGVPDLLQLLAAWGPCPE